MTSEIKVDTISEQTSANGVTIDGLTIKDGNIIGDVALAGTTPTFTIGDGGAEDASLIFDGNAQNFHIGLDDSEDKLTIGLGNNLGTTPAITIDENTNIVIPDSSLTIAGTGNYALLTLKSTDNDTLEGPFLNFVRDPSDVANGDLDGTIKFTADNNAGEAIVYNELQSSLGNVADGSEGGRLTLYQIIAGTTRNIMDISQGNVIFNQDSIDGDFRVESNGNANMLFVDGGSDFVAIGTNDSNSSTLNVSGATTSNQIMVVDSTSSSYGGDGIQRIFCSRANTTAYEFMRVFSGAGSDVEFILRGDGNAFADNAWNASGADYAEYFEWKDGNSASEDRRGYSVILDGNKIVQATDSDDTSKIIGVISGNPAMVGDGAYTKWNDKYLKDDFGVYIREEYTVTEWSEGGDKEEKYHSYETDKIPSDVTVPDNATVITTEEDGATKLTRRKINPSYDETKDYVPRENRKEWDTVGLMGKLRLRKGQPTGTNWIKMRDISDTVEEWLVR
jgi:prepilin-type processing-associated H-X9-DG protein